MTRPPGVATSRWASTRLLIGASVGLTAEAEGKRLADLTHYGWGRTATFHK